MNFNNYTIKSQAVQKAMEIATANQNQAIENIHLLKALLEVDENVIPFLLKKNNVNTQILSQTIDKIIESLPKVSGGNPYLTNDTDQALLKATLYLKDFGDEFVSIKRISGYLKSERYSFRIQEQWYYQ